MAKRIMVKIDEYQKEGKTKGKYLEAGVILENANGEFILLHPEINLAGVLTKQNLLAHAQGKKPNTSVMCSIFNDQPESAHQQALAPEFNDDSDILF